MKPSLLYAKIFFTGGLVLGLELLASRILTPFFGVSLYVWSAILSVTLIALALGYQGGGMISQRAARPALPLLFASAGGVAALWLCVCVWSYPFLFWPLADFNLVAGSIAACLYLLFVPLLVLSALNPLLVAIIADSQGDHGAGRVFFISTLGSVAGVFVVAYGLVPHLTNYMAVVLLTFLAALSSVLLLVMMPRTRGFLLALSVSGLAVLIAGATLLTGGLERFKDSASSGGVEWRVVHGEPSYFGYTQIVDIQTDKGFQSRYLMNDGLSQNRFSQGVSTALYTYALERLGLMNTPEDARRALVLGIGGGVIPTRFAAAGLAVDAVDINPKVVQVAEEYLGFDPWGINIIIGDARTVVRHCDKGAYDVVAVDLFHGDGVPEHLVTREFFSDLKSCMRDGGALVMNSFVDLDDPRAEYALVKTLADVFGRLEYMERPLHGKSRLTVAFIVTRKNADVKNIADVPIQNMPPQILAEFEETLGETITLTADHPLLDSVPVLTDISNQWKHLAYDSELAHRRNAIALLPWTVLMN